MLKSAVKKAYQFFVYILKCSDNTYYTGVTNNLQKRLWEHNNSFAKSSYTAKRLPVELVWHGNFNDIKVAIAFEKKLKKWSQKKKEALIRNDWDMVSEFGKKVF